MEKLRKNIFEELEKVKKLVQEILPEHKNLPKLLSILGTYHYNKKKYILLGKERVLYNKLIENSFNPFTAYKWALLERIPEDIRYQLKNGLISQKNASKAAVSRRRETETSMQRSIRQIGIILVRGL